MKIGFGPRRLMCIIQTLLTRFIAFQADHAIYYPWHKSTIKSKPNRNNLFIRLMRTSYRKIKLYSTIQIWGIFASETSKMDLCFNSQGTVTLSSNISNIWSKDKRCPIEENIFWSQIVCHRHASIKADITDNTRLQL